MTQTLATTTEVLKTVKLDWTSSQIVRIVANIDFPEYSVRKGQTVYLVRSSANDGTYYLLTWGDRKATGWGCTCKGYEAYGKCRHVKLAGQHSRERAKRLATQKVAQEQAKKERMVQYRVAAFFEALYVHAMNEVVHQPVQGMQVVAANPNAGKLMKVSLKSDAPLQGRGFTAINGIPMR